VPKFGSGNRGNADRLICMRGHGRVEIEDPPFRRNQNRRVDQRAHGDLRSDTGMTYGAVTITDDSGVQHYGYAMKRLLALALLSLPPSRLAA